MNTRDLGRWRKLWTRPSATWELLPLSARGLGDELIRYCDEQGRITRPSTMQPHEVCARLLRAHHSEMRRVKADLEALVADGFVVVTNDALVVRNFIEAQAGVTESGERMREKRARDAEGATPRVGADVPRVGKRVPRVGGELPRVEDGANPSEPKDPARHCDLSEKREEERRGELRSAGAPEALDAQPSKPTPSAQQAQDLGQSSTPAAVVNSTAKAVPAAPEAAPSAPVVATATATGAGSDPERSGVVRCATVERTPVDLGRRRLADAMLEAFFTSTVVDHRATPDVVRDFVDACVALDVQPDELRVLNEYLDANRAAWAWTRRTRLDLSWFLGGSRGRGSNLTEQMAKAREWHVTHAETVRREAEHKARAQALVLAAAPRRDFDREANAKLAREQVAAFMARIAAEQGAA